MKTKKMALFKNIKTKLKYKKKSIKRFFSRNTDTKNDIKQNEAEFWLETYAKKYEYSDFKNIRPIGRGSSGAVFRAKRKNKIYALKSFQNDKTFLIVRELKLHKIVNTHKNILRFYGITKLYSDETEIHQINKYCLVLEYADSGTLNDFLNEHRDNLLWDDKLNLALQLAHAVSHLHKNDIIHRDLHANNILIHNKTIKLSDFGLSEEAFNKTSKETGIFGIVPYIDPKHFIIENYKLSKKSDVYSVGVLLWQITSGHKPFDGINYDVRLSLAIVNGEREKIIEGTPVEYSDLYEDCWNDEPNKRPDILQVTLSLKQLIKSTKNYMNVNKITNYKNVNKIAPEDLINPAIKRPNDQRGKCIRKIYRGQEVACQSILKTTEPRLIRILMETSQCKHILRFYGTSIIENNNVMIFEWAEKGTLKDLYEKKRITENCKIRTTLEICRGLVFLQDAGILHNNLKCQNILITGSFEPRIYNFELAHHYHSDENIPSLSMDSAMALRWMAPERLTNSQYAAQSEIFSFGMLFWELTFEKIPYKGWTAEKIKGYVTKGGREKILFEPSTSKTYQTYQDGFKKIMNETWKDDPHERITFKKLLDMLEELYSKLESDNNYSGIYPDKFLDLDDDLELPDEDN